MISEKKISRLVNEKLEGSEVFLTGIVIKPGNVIRIFLDGDRSITIDDCVDVSRYVESSLDREAEDFELQVSSAGIDHPIKHFRQYKKNVGRGLKLDLTDGGSLEGELKEADEEGITILPYAPKKGKSKKKARTTKTEEEKRIDYALIKEAKVLISFK